MATNCEWHAPYPRWALEPNPDGYHEEENWKSLERHWSYFIRNCLADLACEDHLEFSLADTITAPRISAPEPVKQGIRFTQGKVSIYTASSDTIEIAVYRINVTGGDTPVLGITVPALTRYYEIPTFDVEVNEAEALYAVITVADGADGENITLRIWGDCEDIPPHTGGC